MQFRASASKLAAYRVRMVQEKPEWFLPQITQAICDVTAQTRQAPQSPYKALRWCDANRCLQWNEWAVVVSSPQGKKLCGMQAADWLRDWVQT